MTRFAAHLLLAACAKENVYKPPAPPVVTVAPPQTRDVQEYFEFTGTTVAYRIVEIRARVRGYLAEIAYQPGEVVEEGAVLFRIDPAEYEATVHSAQADLESSRADQTAAEAAIQSAEASLALAKTAVKKLEKAYASRAVSEIMVLEVKAKRDVAQAELDRAKAQLEVAKSHVGVAAARLEKARLDLNWTTVKAPIRGRVAMWNVEVGALVGASDPTLLTSIFNTEKIYCYFDVTEHQYLQVREAIRQEVGRLPEATDVPVEIALANEEDFRHRGVGDYTEPTLDPDTGTLRLRAIFDNKERWIPSGAFARVRVPIFKRKNALLVTERALGVDQFGDFVLVVNAEDLVERRGVELGSRQGHSIVVLDGVKPGDRVIVSGLQRARAGAKVKPEAAKKQ
jgi:RND family efflux transporter MFP subunit